MTLSLRRSTPRPNLQTRRPEIEALESRLVPTSFNALGYTLSYNAGYDATTGLYGNFGISNGAETFGTGGSFNGQNFAGYYSYANGADSLGGSFQGTLPTFNTLYNDTGNGGFNLGFGFSGAQVSAASYLNYGGLSQSSNFNAAGNWAGVGGWNDQGLQATSALNYNLNFQTNLNVGAFTGSLGYSDSGQANLAVADGYLSTFLGNTQTISGMGQYGSGADAYTGNFLATLPTINTTIGYSDGQVSMLGELSTGLSGGFSSGNFNLGGGTSLDAGLGGTLGYSPTGLSGGVGFQDTGGLNFNANSGTTNWNGAYSSGALATASGSYSYLDGQYGANYSADLNQSASLQSNQPGFANVSGQDSASYQSSDNSDSGWQDWQDNAY